MDEMMDFMCYGCGAPRKSKTGDMGYCDSCRRKFVSHKKRKNKIKEAAQVSLLKLITEFSSLKMRECFIEFKMKKPDYKNQNLPDWDDNAYEVVKCFVSVRIG